MIRALGLAAAVVMPLWNIPLIIKIQQRRSSKDISLPWAVGVFVCIVLMLPSAVVSPDRIFQLFAFVNTVFFGAVVIQVVRYR